MSWDVMQRSVALERAGRVVPGHVWEPAGCPRSPVVLLGHGGSGSKRAPRITRLASWFAGRAGITAAAIDGPFHGDRVTRPLPATEYQQLIADEGLEQVTKRMVDDWLLLLAHLSAGGVVDTDRVGYVGLSMGTRFGIPLAAALGTRLRCAVFGKFGLRQNIPMNPALEDPDLIVSAAQRVTAPIALYVRWDDELFPRSGQLELFEAFASVDKVLICRPGSHNGSHGDDEPLWCRFIDRRLRLSSG